MIAEWTAFDVTIVDAPTIRELTPAGTKIDFTLGTVQAQATAGPSPRAVVGGEPQRVTDDTNRCAGLVSAGRVTACRSYWRRNGPWANSQSSCR